MDRCLYLFLIVIVLVGSVVLEVSGQDDLNQFLLIKETACIDLESCGACMSALAACRWCADPYFSKTQPRCNSYERLLASSCSQDLIQREEPDVYEVIEDRPLEDIVLGSTKDVIQIQPQRIRLSLKPHESKKIKFAYRPAKNYPLDLYYLMDLTWSMRDDKETLVSLRDDLPIMLKNLTDNFKLGFGSFAEKPLMPYISVDEKRRVNPCAGEEEVCESTYSFHHRLPLTNQINDFINEVNRSAVTANLDNAEAQLDALMQVLVCGDRVGWSHRSRKIVMVLTDGIPHTAGDGKLGGATRRNDEACHLDNRGYYSVAETYDYPSIAQIYKLLDSYKVNVIFAVTSNLKNYYDRLQKVLDNSYVGILESDSSNILKLVKKGYEEIVSVVNFKDNGGGPIKVKYFSDCGVRGSPLKETTTCRDIEFGKTINFEVHLTLDACPEFVKINRTIDIMESKLGQDSIKLDVELQCGCYCDIKDKTLQSACPQHSSLVCGVCQCEDGWSGPNCDCSIEDEAASNTLIGQCKDRERNISLACSGRGDCVCGSCFCDDSFNGKYCQCGTCDINYRNGLECGGSSQGQCLCGTCVCNPGWSGDSCECPTSVDACVAPGSNLTCSGRGVCECGQCTCSRAQTGSLLYSGAYCEMCPTCENSLCAYAEASIVCHVGGECNDTHTPNNQTFNIIKLLNETAEDDTLQSEPRCILRREDNGQLCEYQYSYSVATAEEVNVVLHSRRCSVTNMAMFFNYGLFIVGGILLVGMGFIICIKVWQINADRRAYEKFQKEAALSLLETQSHNPLYISPITEFKMPEAFPRDKED